MSAGTINQVYEHDGNGMPSWLDPSTVIYAQLRSGKRMVNLARNFRWVNDFSANSQVDLVRFSLDELEDEPSIEDLTRMDSEDMLPVRWPTL